MIHQKRKYTLVNILRVVLPVVCFALFILWTIQKNLPTNIQDFVPSRLKATFAYQAAKWYNDRRAFPSGTIPVDWKEKALNHIEQNQNRFAKTSGVTQLSWQSLGPVNIAGRLRSIVIDKDHPETLYVGSVSGGIWKTMNGGSSWASTSDFATNICIGTMVMHPTNPNILYAGTGEGYFNIDALRGAGILKSTNGGGSWTTITNFSNEDVTLQSGRKLKAYHYINKLIIRPDNPDVLYAGVVGGVWKSTDAGSSWKKLNVGNTDPFCMDLVANPDFPDVMYASFGLFMPYNDGIYKTTDGGANWTKLTNGFPSATTGYTRISLAIAPSEPDIIYASLSDSNFYTHSIQKSTNAGGSWFAVSTPYDNSPYVRGTHLGGQGFYNNVLAVHPTNENIVYAGGINIFRSSNGGTGWTRLIDANGVANFHVDQHVITFHPKNPSTIFFGNDGGIYKTTNDGVSFGELNNDLVVTQFYSGATHPTLNYYFGGTQDNGTLMRSTSTSWQPILSGDGGPVIVNPQDPNIVYMTYVYLSVWKSTNGGTGPTRMMSGIPTEIGVSWTSDRCSFIAPLVMDPNNPNVLVGGTYRLFKTSSAAESWSAITEDLTGSGAGSVQSSGATITAIAIAKQNSSVMYVGTSGWSGVRSRVLVTTNGGGGWVVHDQLPLPNREVTSIAIDPLNASKAYVGYSGYGLGTATTGHVYLTTNRGSNWSNVSGNLPDVPVNSIVIDPKQSTHVIIGTDLGVFETTNGGTTWTQENEGLANVAVHDLDIREDGYILAATHGRGMFLSKTDLYSGLALYFPSQNASNISTSPTLRWKHSDSATTYRLQVATDPTFAAGIAYSDSNLTDTVHVISGLSLNTMYYWQVSIKKLSGKISSSPIWSFTTIGTYPTSFSASATIDFPNYSSQESYATKDYRLVGLPGLSNLRIDSLLSGTHKTDWQIYWDNGAASEYLIEYNGSSDFRFSSGRAFWMLNKRDWNFSGTLNSMPMNNDAVEIPLHPGWNMITSPYPFAVTWATIKSANSVNESLWGFKGSFTASSSLEPYYGFYFFNATNLSSLKIPYGSSLGKTIADEVESECDWQVSIGLQTKTYTENVVAFGVVQTSSNGLDRYDVRRPRAVGETPSVIFSRKEWDDLYSSFATDFKPEIQDSQRWRFEVLHTNKQSVKLSFDGIATIPEEFDVYLIDEERGVKQNLRSNPAYSFSSTSDKSEFVVLVGKNEAIAELLNNVAPKEFYLSDNYPNPFNPTTNFEFRIANFGLVSLKIYNLAGQEVATLINEAKQSGTYTVEWNASDMPSGVYLAQLRAGTYSSVKKILLIK
ncbi:MAG: T9SS type A sorting domain-containing protein [Ignavibacteriae bacterium]|nr:T9SS type A sorting domain-containing protein [Ignavibacteriota bacterium]